MVDDYYMTRGLTRPGGFHSSKVRKRSADGKDDGEGPGGKKMKMPEANEDKGVATGVMTTDQIRAMMSNTLKEIQARKNALSSLRGAQAAKAPGVTTIPPPPQVLSGPKLPQVGPVKSGEDSEKAKTIAALQAQIAARLNKVGINPGTTTTEIQRPPQALILDAEGRTVDAMGQEIQLGHHVPTLKANLRARKGKDEGNKDQDAVGSSHDESTAYFDPRVAAKGASRPKRMGFSFVEPGNLSKRGIKVENETPIGKASG